MPGAGAYTMYTLGWALARAGQVVDHLLVASRVEVQPSEASPDGHRRGIQLERRVALDDPLLQPPLGRQQERIPLMRRRVARIELDRTAELPIRAGPVPVIGE